jgi:hypothetical protein
MNARAIRRTRERKLIKASRAAVKAQGCVCDVEIVPVGDEEYQARHDDWCPLLRVMEEREPGLARSQVILANLDRF